MCNSRDVKRPLKVINGIKVEEKSECNGGVKEGGEERGENRGRSREEPHCVLANLY